MMPETITFFIIAFFLVIMSILVVILKNPRHTTFFLMLVFLHAAALLILLHAEFLGIAIAIIYICVIPIVFLLLKATSTPKDFTFIDKNSTSYTVCVCVLSLFLLGELFLYIMTWKFSSKIFNVIENPMAPREENALSIGDLIFTDYFFPFQILGIALLATMVGVVALSIHSKSKKTSHAHKEPTESSFNTSIKLVNVPFDKGVINHD